MTVKIFTISTTGGVRYGLVNARSGDVLINATAKWRTTKGAENFAAKMGFKVIK